MSERAARKARRKATQRRYAPSIAQHAADIEWFSTHRDALWRVRRRVATECDAAPESTHMLVVHDRTRDRWFGRPLLATSDEDAYEQGVVALVALLQSHVA